MSVKLTRREEKRNTSLRDFLLAATLPLLLVGAIGYLIGANNAGDSQKNAIELEKMKKEAANSKRELKALNKYLNFVDSMHTEMIEGRETLKDEYTNAISREDDGFSDPLGEWARDVGEYGAKIGRRFDGGVGKVTGEAVISGNQVDVPSFIFKDLLREIIDSFDQNLKSKRRTGANQDEFSDELEDLQNKCDETESRLNLDIRGLKRDVARLETDRDKLREQLGRKEPCATVECPDYSSDKEQIKDVLSEIQTSLDGLDIKGKNLLGIPTNKKSVTKVNQFQVNLKALLRDADKYVDRIE